MQDPSVLDGDLLVQMVFVSLESFVSRVLVHLVVPLEIWEAIPKTARLEAFVL